MLQVRQQQKVMPKKLWKNGTAKKENEKEKKRHLLDRKFHRLLSVSDSNESNTAAPINRYVNVQMTSDNVRTFCRFIL